MSCPVILATELNCESSIAISPANTRNTKNILAQAGRKFAITIALVVPTMLPGISIPDPAATYPSSPIITGMIPNTNAAIINDFRTDALRIANAL